MTELDIVSKDIFDRLLVSPVERGCSELHAITTDASGSMVTRHFEALANKTRGHLSISLHLGATGRDGLEKRTLLGLRSIPRQIGDKEFSCTFAPRGKSTQSNLYVWCDESGPREAYLAATEYTQRGFGILQDSKTHHGAFASVNPETALQFVFEESKDGVSYRSEDVFSHIDIHESAEDRGQNSKEHEFFETPGENFADLPLIILKGPRAGEVHEKSGINWGQRESRNPNQAYIPIPSKIARSGFFPERGVHFQVLTESGEAFICTVAQDGGKAIETPANNSILGLHLREALGLSPGEFVTRKALDAFGSNAVRFARLDHETYRLVFRPGLKIQKDQP